SPPPADAGSLRRTLLRIAPIVVIAAGVVGVALARSGRRGPADTSALARSPGWALFQAGLQLSQQGRHAEAADRFQAAVARDPTQARFHYQLGIARYRLDDFRAAREAHERGVAAVPGDSSNWEGLGAVAIRIGEFEEAKRDLEKAVSLDPVSVRAHYHLGLARYEGSPVLLGALTADRAELERAVASFTRASELDPKLDQAPLYAGLACERARDLDAASRWFKRALAVNPQLAPAHLRLGVLELRDGDLDGAAAELGRALELEPRSGEAHYQLGLLREAESKDVEACAAFARSVELDPSRAEAYFRHATVLRRLGRVPEADKALAEFKALRTATEDLGSFVAAARAQPTAQTQFQLGVAYTKARKSDAARKAYESALARDPRHVGALANLAGLQLQRGEAGAARRGYEQAIAISPGDARLQRGLARACLLLEDRDGALAAARKACELDAGHPESHAALAAAHQAKGSMPDAIRAWERALELDPRSAVFRTSLGGALLATGDLERAGVLGREALAAAPDYEPARKLLQAVSEKASR
ncbi:MAG TPA: tetratricopeptide repeat protein, partial [Planctomycetota bacterium]|nr:tetratricopeptide repeat protein [Planctomycetota bacterium]